VDRPNWKAECAETCLLRLERGKGCKALPIATHLGRVDASIRDEHALPQTVTVSKPCLVPFRQTRLTFQTSSARVASPAEPKSDSVVAIGGLVQPTKGRSRLSSRQEDKF